MSKERLLAYVEKLFEMTECVEEKLKNKAESEMELRNMSGTDFEGIVYDCLLEAGFKEEAITHSPQRFPDFIIEDLNDGDKIGVEVKKTNENRWEIQGGSIYESLRNDIEETYILMAKLGGTKPEVRIRKYEECISELKVTHSPRVHLNLDLETGADLLSQNDAKNLAELTGEELNRKIRKLVRTPKSTWWSSDETIAFSDLPQEEKEIYLNEGMVLFPEVFKGNYSKFTPWLVYDCLVWCGNVRDIFSSRGDKYIEEKHIYISAIMKRALDNVDSIKERILRMTEEEQNKFWGKSGEDFRERIKIWIDLVEDNLRFSADLIKNNKTLEMFERFDDARICQVVKKVFISELSSKLLCE